MNRNVYTSQCTVPSLSIASSRSRKNIPIPTKDTNIDIQRLADVKPRQQILERINRQPIFNPKVHKQERIQVENKANYLRNQSGSKIIHQISTLNRNVYLNREQPTQSNMIRQQPLEFVQYNQQLQLGRSPSASSLLRNPQSNRLVSIQIERKLQQKKMDTTKSLFERRIKKLLQEAEFYDKQLMEMYEDNNELMMKKLSDLEQCKREALSMGI